MTLAGCLAIGPVGSHWVVAHVAAGLQQGEATGQVGGHCMMARGVNRHDNRGSQQHHRPAMMGRLGVADELQLCQWTISCGWYRHGSEADVTGGHLCG